MPLGLPNIAIDLPKKEEEEEEEEEEEDKNQEWYDLYSGLSRLRIIFIYDELSEEIVNQTMGLIASLSIQNSKADIFCFINSPGGTLILGSGLYDMMNSVPPDINTTSIGVAASMASYILAGGEKTKRLATAYSRIMLHQPAAELSVKNGGTVAEFLHDVRELAELREHVVHNYAKQTGQPYWAIEQMIDRDAFLSASEAKTFGIVDDIMNKEHVRNMSEKMKKYQELDEKQDEKQGEVDEEEVDEEEVDEEDVDEEEVDPLGLRR